MIGSAQEYSFVGGDIGDIIVNGEIMPYRTAERRKDLRGEDITFLLEGAIERLSWWYSRLDYNQDDGTYTENINPNGYYAQYPSGGFNQWPFSRCVTAGDAMLAHALQGNFFTPSGSANWRPFYYGDLEEAAAADTLAWQDVQPILVGRHVPSFSTYNLVASRISGMFADLETVKYASHPFLSDNVSDTALRVEYLKAGIPSTDHSPSSSCIAAYRAENWEQYYSTCASTLMGSLILVQNKFGFIADTDNFGLYTLIDIEGRYGTGSGRPGEYFHKKKIANLKSMTASYFRNDRFVVFTPVVTRAWIMSVLDECGVPVYTAQQCQDEQGLSNGKFCEYYVRFYDFNMHLSTRLYPKTAW